MRTTALPRYRYLPNKNWRWTLHGAKGVLKKVFGTNADTINQRLQMIQQVGWIIGITIWVPAQILWVSILLNQT